MPSAVHPMSQAGVPAPAPARVTAANWQFAPHSRWGFCNVRRVLPTARVGRGAGPAHRFAEQRSDLSALPVPLPGGARQALAQVLDDSCTDGFLVLHRGRIVYERYSGELRPDQTHIIMSVSKSLIGSLIGILAERGVLDLARPAGH